MSEPKPRFRDIIASRKMLVILALGAASGFPNQITESALQAWLKDAGSSNTRIGLFTYVAVPYLLKFLWAPFLDRYPLPFLGRMMDEMSKNFPVSETYNALWCWTWDNNAFTRLNRMDEMAFAAGFTGQRGVRTFQDRLKRLEAMGFVELKAAGNSKMAFAYLPNPHVVMFHLYDALTSPGAAPEMREIARGLQEGTFNAFLARAQELGSKDVLEILEARAGRAAASVV